LLVDIDSSAKSQPALDLASLLARRSGARLRIVDSVKEPEEDPLFGSAAATGFTSRAFSFRRGPMPHELLIQEVERFGHDLLIRSRERDIVAAFATRTFGINNRLFRPCPCPVWAVGVRPNLYGPRILVAVNPISDDPLTNALDAGAIQLALVISNLLDGKITVFHAWRQPAEKKVYLYLTEAEAESCLRTTERHASDALVRLVDSFGQSMTGCRIELKRGAEEKIIPAFVVSEGIDVVITGARPETGIWRLLFGSTAEELLKATPCSVIAFKASAYFESRCHHDSAFDAP
jgi:universal stress protein E